MKKILIISILLLLVSCSNLDREALTTYEEMVFILNDAADYASSSNYFDINITYDEDASNDEQDTIEDTVDDDETTAASSEKRFYIVIDNPKIAMYDVKAMAFEEGADTNSQFAPSVGIFDSKFNLVPNQTNLENGFAKGITISGTYSNDVTSILCLVQWINNDNSKVYREYFKFNK